MSAAAIILDLPFPISVNCIWRSGRRRVFRSEEYLAWIQQAEALCVYLGSLRGAQAIVGPFDAEIVLDVNERARAGDLDNRLKVILDFAQRVELIRNDRDLERLTACWGEAPRGCRLTLAASTSRCRPMPNAMALSRASDERKRRHNDQYQTFKNRNDSACDR
jgi:hypothetical protein